MMARRGHRHWYWLLAALLLGPMAIPILAERTEGETPHHEILRTGHIGPGRHLVVGIDGSTHAAHAATAALDLLRGSLGQVTLATVVDYDTDPEDDKGLQRARSRLDAAAAGLDDWDPAQAILTGTPAAALLAFAADQHADLIAVGPVGRGVSQRLVGSVTSGLLARSPIPVLIIRDRY
jgi:nucleotide-binding universal stress UspA family protein